MRLNCDGYDQYWWYEKGKINRTTLNQFPGGKNCVAILSTGFGISAMQSER